MSDAVRTPEPGLAELPAGPLLADLCHHVRTPLNGILGTLELLLQGDLPDDARELVRVAYDSATCLHQVFEDDVLACCEGAPPDRWPSRSA